MHYIQWMVQVKRSWKFERNETVTSILFCVPAIWCGAEVGLDKATNVSRWCFNILMGLANIFLWPGLGSWCPSNPALIYLLKKEALRRELKFWSRCLKVSLLRTLLCWLLFVLQDPRCASRYQHLNTFKSSMHIVSCLIVPLFFCLYVVKLSTKFRNIRRRYLSKDLHWQALLTIKDLCLPNFPGP